MTGNSNTELVADFTLHLRAERGLSPNTVLAYTGDLWQFIEVLELKSDATLLTAARQDVLAFVHHLSAHDICNRSLARKIASLRTFYRWLVMNERLEVDPMRLTVLPKLKKLLPRPVEARSISTILDSMAKRASANDATPFEMRDYAIFETLYSAGVRVSELCGLRQQDVALDAGTAHVLGKGGKERIVPLGVPAVAAIENYIRHARQQLVKPGKARQHALFLSEQGTQITQRRVRYITVAAGGDLDHINPHRLRHSAATHMLRGQGGQGADIRSVQEMLGHANLGTTEIYTQVSKDQLQQAHARFHPRG